MTSPSIPKLTKAGQPWRGHLRGFASLPPDVRRDLASKGGREAHRRGTAHRWSREAARVAGKKGGQAGGNGQRRPRSTVAA
jgi:general stress protein YciG